MKPSDKSHAQTDRQSDQQAPRDDGWIEQASAILRLAAAQIQAARSSGEQNIDRLGICFDTLSKAVSEQEYARQSPESGDLASTLNEAIVCMQFYDRMSQRLAAAERMLSRVAGIMNQERKRTDLNTWSDLDRATYGHYTSEAEQAVHVAVQRSLGTRAAVKHDGPALPPADGVESPGDVELF
ncbi:MAG: hypothetical protein KDK91_06890 [Gammaproteobacteria bacterium]|nr:hypothetical protein [Gammaproteobacteria bacterium]